MTLIGTTSGKYSDDILVENIQERDFIYDSTVSGLNIYKKGVRTVTTNGSGNATTYIHHNLGYSPAFFVWKLHNAEWYNTDKSNIDSTTYQQVYFPANGNRNNWDSDSFNHTAWSNNNDLAIELTGASASTTYTFAYYIFSNPTKEVENLEISGEQNIGVKQSPEGTNVTDGVSSSDSVTTTTQTLKLLNTLGGIGHVEMPTLSGDLGDKTPSMGSYIDIKHGLKYPPFVLGYARLSGSNYPTAWNLLPSFSTDSADGIRSVEDYWVDSTRIRFSVWRQAVYDSAPISDLSYSAETISFKWVIFDEDLSSL